MSPVGVDMDADIAVDLSTDLLQFEFGLDGISELYGFICSPILVCRRAVIERLLETKRDRSFVLGFE